MRCSARVLADIGIEREDIPLVARAIDQEEFGQRATAARRPRPEAPRPPQLGRLRPSELSLALQGGGAHGAFTWGVLDRLLEAERFRYQAISGTSAGAINAVVFASGWLADGAAGARANLAELWRRVVELARPLQGALPQLTLDLASQLLSPYQLNPLGINPLRELLERLVDFERLRRAQVPKLFVAATNLRTGAARIFENRDLSPDAVLASACLPWLHQAVEIEGDAYWDGGYVSNPPLLPLVERCPTRDLLLVRINPSARDTLPRSVGEIRNRIGEIVFDQPLERELALLAARRRAHHPALSPAQRRLARHRLHVIDGGAWLAALDPSTKVAPSSDTLARLRDLGRAAASGWLDGAAAPRRPDASMGRRLQAA
jgi:NTE family protein